MDDYVRITGKPEVDWKTKLMGRKPSIFNDMEFDSLFANREYRIEACLGCRAPRF